MTTVKMTTAEKRAWAAIERLTEQQAETDRQIKETGKQIKETEKLFKESKIENDRRMNELKEVMGRWANNHGFVAEEYFINSFKRGQRNFFGEKFDKMVSKAPGIKIETEYDMVLLNGKTVAIVEVKYKAHINDIPKLLKKSETFRINYPDFAGHQIYLGIASMAFYPELEEQCIESGIAIIKQIGETVVINDSHLKVF
jgi:hypothetical protein